jgi:hypothetical protein
LKIKNGKAVITATNDVFTLERLNLDASVKNKRIFFNGGFGTAFVFEKLINAAPVTAHVGVELDGSCGLDLNSLAARLSLTSLKSDSIALKPLRFNITLADEVFTFASADERLPFDVSARADLASGTLSGGLWVADFSPADAVSLTGALKEYQKWLQIKTSGSFSFAIETKNAENEEKREKIWYTANITGSIPPNLPTGRASFAIEGSGTENAVHFDRLFLQTAYGKFGFEGGIGFSPLAPNGKIAVSDFTLSKKAFANANLTISTRGKNISIFGNSLTLGSAVLRDPVALISLDKKGFIWTFSTGEILLDTFSKNEKRRVEAEGAFDYKPRNLEAGLTLDKVLLADFLIMSEPFVDLGATDSIKNIAEKTRISAEVFVDTDFKRLLYNAPEVFIQYGENGESEEKSGKNITARLSLAGTDRRFELNDGYVDWGGGSLDAAFSADFADMNNIAFGASVSYEDSKYSVEGMIIDQNEISAQGSYGLSASLKRIDNEFSGYFEVYQAPFPFQGKTANVSASISAFRFSSLESWRADISSFFVSNLATPASVSASIGLSGYADQDGANFPMLFFDDGDILSGSASAVWKNNFSEFAGKVSLKDGEDKEQYELEITRTGKSDSIASFMYKTELSGVNMRLARFMNDSYGATLTGNVSANWESFDAFLVNAAIISLSADVPGGVRAEISGNARIDKTGASLSGIEIKYSELIGSIQTFSLNLEKGESGCSAHFEGNLFEEKINLDCELEVSYKPVASWLDIQRITENFRGTLRISEAGFGVLKTEEPFSFAFFRENGSMAVSGGPRDMLRFQIANSGDFYAGLSAPFPVRGFVTGRIADQIIDASAPDLYVDLTALWKLIPPQDVIGVSRGFVTASIDIRGPLNAPEFFGSAIGQSVDLTIPRYLAAEIRAVPILVTLNGSEMSFGPIPASVGQGIGEVSGHFRFDQWLPTDFNIDITVPKETPLPFAFDISGIVAKGDVNGDLHISLNDSIFKVAGDLTAQDTEITLNFEEIEAQSGVILDDDPLTYVVDIMVRTGRKVEFLWPSVQLPIIRAYADMGSALKIESDSSSGKLLLAGDIALRSGEIFYYERNFYLQNGTLMFNENEMIFDPHISARAETQDRTEDGPVTISLIIDNSPLSMFTARLEANPPLSQIAILSLLGQNITGAASDNESDSARNTALSSLSAGSDILLRSVAGRQAERNVRNFLHLDMFSFRSPILQNLAFQLSGLQSQPAETETAQTTDQNRITPQRSSGAGNFLDNTSVFIGKYIGASMFAQAMFTFRYDENQQTFGGLKIEPNLGVEMRTPLFDIRWNFVPLHLDHLFVNDLSFTLTWRKSF